MGRADRGLQRGRASAQVPDVEQQADVAQARRHDRPGAEVAQDGAEARQVHGPAALPGYVGRLCPG